MSPPDDPSHTRPAPSPDTLASADWPGYREPPPPALPHFPGYEALRELGRGGMGVVYLARDLRLGRHVALKTLRREGAADPEHLARFRLEAQAIARLTHPNIVTIYEVGEAASTASPSPTSPSS